MSADVEALMRQCRAAGAWLVSVLAHSDGSFTAAAYREHTVAPIDRVTAASAVGALVALRDRLAMQRVFAEAQARVESETAWVPRSLTVVTS